MIKGLNSSTYQWALGGPTEGRKAAIHITTLQQLFQVRHRARQDESALKILTDQLLVFGQVHK
jgi:hypothetical protein